MPMPDSEDQPTSPAEVVEKHGRETIEDPSVRIGDHVTDREEDEGATMVVVERTSHTASEYRLDGSQKTVADVNPGYPATDDVVEVVYPQRETERLADLKQYAFPESRLQVTAPVHDQDEFEGMK